MGIKLSTHDMSLLAGVHQDLRKVVVRAAEITSIPFKVTEGRRTLEKQRQNIKNGVSWTMKSRHLTGHAVDVIPQVDVNKDGTISQSEAYAWPLYYKLAAVFKQAAKDVGVPVEWGGDWRKNKDGPHWQLPWAKYPIAKAASLIGFSTGVDTEEYLGAEPVEGDTEDATHGKTIALVGGGASAGTSMGYQPVLDAINTVAYQQGEITSGQVVRIIIAAIIVGASLWVAWKQWKAQS